MRDGHTRRVQADEGQIDEFLAKHRVSLTVLRGPAAGSEHELDQERVLVGRSDAADLRIDDRSVSHEHAAIELGAEGFGIRDLESTNGVRVNGGTVDTSELKHGDRVQIGECELQYVVERRDPRTWQLGDA